MAARWRVMFDEPSWHVDLASSTPAARAAALAWRRRVELLGYVPDSDVKRCDPADDRLPLPRCVKMRLPDPTTADLKRSPWGVVLEGRADNDGPFLVSIAFGLRHPEAVGSRKPSVYSLAHSRI